MLIIWNNRLSSFRIVRRSVRTVWKRPYAQLNDSVNRVATALIKMGIKPGDHIGLCAPNSTEWIIFYFGVLKAGAIAVTLSAMLTGDELANLVHHARPAFSFYRPVQAP